MPLVGDRVRLAPRPHRSFRRPLRRRLRPCTRSRGPRARRSLIVRPTSSAPTLSTPLVATLTAAAAGRPPSLAATVIAPQSCCVWPRCLRSAGQRSAPANLYPPFLERRILQVGVFGGSGEHSTSRGRAARGPCEFFHSATFLHFS